MTNSTNNISVDISVSSQKLEEVTSFKYLEATLCKDGPAQQKSASGLPLRVSVELYYPQLRVHGTT